MSEKTVSWTSYAAKYDMLMQYNPFYQQLHAEVMRKTDSWHFSKGDIILDLGAGTGNYSTALAARFPQAQVMHVDLDEGMNAVAARKKEQQGLTNLYIKGCGVQDLDFDTGSIAAVTAIHSLYTFPEPERALLRIFRWLKPEGQGVFVNPGRTVNVLDWQFAIGLKMIRQYGLRKTLEIMKEGKEVSRQNREISKLQLDGTYWTHSHEEFTAVVAGCGFEILDHGFTFRNISDWVTVTKGTGSR